MLAPDTLQELDKVIDAGKPVLAFFSDTVWTERDSVRFGCNFFLSQGLQVVVLDCSPVFNPDHAHTRRTTRDSSSWVIVLTRLSVVQESIRRLSAAKAVSVYHGSYDGLYLLLRRSQLPFVMLVVNAVPEPTFLDHFWYPGSSIHRKLDGLARFVVHRFRGLKSHFAMKKRGPELRWPDYVLAGGSHAASRKQQKLTGPFDPSRYIWAHTLDYDTYLKMEESKPETDLGEGQFAVFVDQMLPGHPDFAVIGLEPYVAPDRYYPALRKFFDSVEDRTGIEVRIAAHPRSSYPKDFDGFGERRIIAGQTPLLVKYCSLFLTHFSTSVNFANLWHKPLFFFQLECMNSYSRAMSLAAARAHGQRSVLVDPRNNPTARFPFESLKLLTRPNYEGYRDRYIRKSGSPQQYTYKILYERLLSDGFWAGQS